MMSTNTRMSSETAEHDNFNFEKHCDLDSQILQLSKSEFSDKDVPGLIKFLELHPSITILDLSYTDITDECFKLLSLVPHITTLDIAWTKITSKTASLLANHPALRTLDIAYNYIGDEGVVAIATGKNKIEYLNICTTGATTVSAVALAAKGELKELNIGSNFIEFIDPYPSDQPRHYTARLIATNRNQIGLIGAKALAASKLTALNVCSTAIDSEGINLLAQSSSITRLDLSNMNDATEHAIGLYVGHFSIPNSKFGQTTHNMIDDDNLIVLARNPHVKILNLLGEQNFSFKGITALAANFNLKKLLVSADKWGSEMENLLVYCEYNPITRANNARKLGVETEVPTLRLISMFACRNKKTTVTELQAGIDSMRVTIDVSKDSSRMLRTMNT